MVIEAKLLNFLGNSYTIIANTHCEGTRIKQWKDGLDSNYGKVKMLQLLLPHKWCVEDCDRLE